MLLSKYSFKMFVPGWLEITHSNMLSRVFSLSFAFNSEQRQLAQQSVIVMHCEQKRCAAQFVAKRQEAFISRFNLR